VAKVIWRKPHRIHFLSPWGIKQNPKQNLDPFSRFARHGGVADRTDKRHTTGSSVATVGASCVVPNLKPVPVKWRVRRGGFFSPFLNRPQLTEAEYRCNCVELCSRRLEPRREKLCRPKPRHGPWNEHVMSFRQTEVRSTIRDVGSRHTEAFEFNTVFLTLFTRQAYKIRDFIIALVSV